MAFIDYYDVLQVSPHADAEVIEKAYRALISKHHPDKGGDTRHAQRLNEAHDVIGDPSKRAAYDREWARQHRRTTAAPSRATSEPVAVHQPAPRATPRQSAWARSSVLGLVLVLLGLAFLATGSGFLGLLLTGLGLLFIFNLWGVWLAVGLLALVIGLAVRYAFGGRRSAYR